MGSKDEIALPPVPSTRCHNHSNSSLIPNRVDSSGKVLEMKTHTRLTAASQVEARLVDGLVTRRSKMINPVLLKCRLWVNEDWSDLDPWGAIKLRLEGEAGGSAIGVSGDDAFAGFNLTDTAVLSVSDCA